MQGVLGVTETRADARLCDLERVGFECVLGESVAKALGMCIS